MISSTSPVANIDRPEAGIAANVALCSFLTCRLISAKDFPNLLRAG